jgi:hypothetical protein
MAAPMSFSAFPHGRQRPSEQAVLAALGPARAMWSRVLARLAEQFDATDATWHSYGRISGWNLNVKDGRGTLAYLYPQRHGLIAVVTLTHEAAGHARAFGGSSRLAEAIAQARPYAKGHSVSVDVCGEDDLGLVVELCRLKRGARGSSHGPRASGR